MDEPLKSFLKERKRFERRSAWFLRGMLVVCAGFTGACLMQAACSSASTPPVVAKAETDLCKARADWLLAVAVDPALAPAPGSVRARLEAAEDAFCAAEKAAP